MNQGATAANPPASPSDVAAPIWPNLYASDVEGPYLIGGGCTACGYTTLEVRPVCPMCWKAGSMQARPIGRSGTLYTFTVIHQAPPGFDSPLAVGYVDLAEGPRVFAHLERTPETLRIGATLSLSIEPLKRADDGTVRHGPRYRAAPARPE